MNDHRTTCDPQRIELFLEQKLSDEEQSAFESHLSDCDDCRRRLETTAASEDVWSEMRESLRDEQLPPDGLRSGDSRFDRRGCFVRPGHRAEAVGAHGRRSDDRPLGDV